MSTQQQYRVMLTCRVLNDAWIDVQAADGKEAEAKALRVARQTSPTWRPELCKGVVWQQNGNVSEIHVSEVREMESL